MPISTHFVTTNDLRHSLSSCSRQGGGILVDYPEITFTSSFNGSKGFRKLPNFIFSPATLTTQSKNRIKVLRS